MKSIQALKDLFNEIIKLDDAISLNKIDIYRYNINELISRYNTIINDLETFENILKTYSQIEKNENNIYVLNDIVNIFFQTKEKIKMQDEILNTLNKYIKETNND